MKSPPAVKGPPVAQSLPNAQTVPSLPLASLARSVGDNAGSGGPETDKDQDDMDEVDRWVAELKEPPAKSPPPEPVYYRVMPPPPGDAEQLDGRTQCSPPAAAPVGDTAVVTSSSTGAKPGDNGAAAFEPYPSDAASATAPK